MRKSAWLRCGERTRRGLMQVGSFGACPSRVFAPRLVSTVVHRFLSGCCALHARARLPLSPSLSFSLLYTLLRFRYYSRTTFPRARTDAHALLALLLFASFFDPFVSHSALVLFSVILRKRIESIENHENKTAVML